MSQYQPYQQAQYPHNADAYPQPHAQQSFPPGAHPQNTQPPTTAYQPQQPVSEKPQPHVHAHAVGQQHSGSKFGNKWLFGLFDCFSPFGTCCLGTWCPCILAGKTYAREHGEGETDGFNMMCIGNCCAISFGFAGCLQCIMRSQQREKYGIESNSFNDFCISCCCSCCALIQEDKESIVRTTGMNPKTNIAYQPVHQGMQYPA
ncbi:hypothetical protein LTR05_005803 [Lithohypha guttulata]|uniref:PLAC8 family-domain-containing protein n=1 Tax=Lithohypha guttulata TaxID=1690604 RepID=A0AAN7SYD2_9EURO|nr:hypothetical protein LTR05_005803 [Lithohypha guttulata]